jgi:hypothetical protein
MWWCARADGAGGRSLRQRRPKPAPTGSAGAAVRAGRQRRAGQWRGLPGGGGLCWVPTGSSGYPQPPRSHGFRALAHPPMGDCTVTVIRHRFLSTRRHPRGRVHGNRRLITLRVHSPQHPCASARKPLLEPARGTPAPRRGETSAPQDRVAARAGSCGGRAGDETGTRRVYSAVAPRAGGQAAPGTPPSPCDHAGLRATPCVSVRPHTRQMGTPASARSVATTPAPTRGGA